MKRTVRDIFVTAGILIAAFLISVAFQNVFRVDEHISTLFAFAVFLISMLTQGYVYGIVSAFFSTLAINYAFTFPYFAFNFTIPVNLISALVMITIALLTGALTTKVKYHEAIKAESEKEHIRANLLRAVSHDIRTPLTTIYGSAATLLESKDDLSETQKENILKGIKEDSDWLVRMVENLLSVTRIDSGKVKILKTPTVVDELIDSVLVKFKKRYPEQKVLVTLPEELMIVPMDPLLIEQVLVNLLENAVMHADGFDCLSLCVSHQDGRAVFEVQDNGCGIPAEKLPKLFETYFEPDNNVADGKKRNAGIGLAVCAAIIRAHDGEICAENPPEGGAVFRFMLTISGEQP